ncbi:hypothetical protein JOF47_001720 [Paeniglutamicibacter kerguelensis]|uniref:Uncharacterized protein n=1 Tax=Paeniglutamicibacter kerguelensis TaxID=254788 RepID=A0ABS4XCK9_9MICC|nr:hypothetical protein [Paeniglutamicibacter kerguelensis]
MGTWPAALPASPGRGPDPTVVCPACTEFPKWPALLLPAPLMRLRITVPVPWKGTLLDYGSKCLPKPTLDIPGLGSRSRHVRSRQLEISALNWKSHEPKMGPTNEENGSKCHARKLHCMDNCGCSCGHCLGDLDRFRDLGPLPQSDTKNPATARDHLWIGPAFRFPSMAGIDDYRHLCKSRVRLTARSTLRRADERDCV